MNPSNSSGPPRPAISFLTLPPEIRTRIYTHLLPITISLSVKTDSVKNDLALTTPNPSTDATTIPTTSHHTSSSKATPSPTAPDHRPTLLHLHSCTTTPPSSPLPTALPITYLPPTYRYARASRLLTNATRPPFRELALTCRTVYNELAPQIAGTLSIDTDSLPVACVFAARLGGLARFVREIAIRRPFLCRVEGIEMQEDDGGDGGDDADATPEGVEQTKAWVRMMAGLLPGLRKLAFADVVRVWVFSEMALSRVLDGDGDEGQDEVDDAEMGRWGWDRDQLRVLREVALAWKEQGQMLVPVSAKQVAGMRQVSVVWEVKGSEAEHHERIWQDQRSGLSLEDEWMAYELLVASSWSKDSKKGGKAVAET